MTSRMRALELSSMLESSISFLEHRPCASRDHILNGKWHVRKYYRNVNYSSVYEISE
jgi:hypothetical protein